MHHFCKKSEAHKIGALLSPEEIEEVNLTFAKEVKEYNFSYDCHQCVHIDPDDMACHMEYPNHQLLRMAAKNWAMNEKGAIEFCKYFEGA